MPTLPKCKLEVKYGFKERTFDILFIFKRMFQIMYFFTIGIMLFAFVIIAVECAFTGKNFLKLFIR